VKGVGVNVRERRSRGHPSCPGRRMRTPSLPYSGARFTELCVDDPPQTTRECSVGWLQNKDCFQRVRMDRCAG